MPKKPFKVLVANAGYYNGIDGSLTDYTRKMHRYLYLSRKNQSQTLSTFSQLLAEYTPDLVCVVEIKKGKQFSFMQEQFSSHAMIYTKYGQKSILRMLPLFYNKGNAFFSKEPLQHKQHFLEHGTKKLLYEIVLPGNVSLFVGHFSLVKRVRARQFLELQKRFSHVEQKIYCGDFNTFSGMDEVAQLMQNDGLISANDLPTFPAFRPKHNLDLVLHSKSLSVSAKPITTTFSDHLPVLFEIHMGQ